MNQKTVFDGVLDDKTYFYTLQVISESEYIFFGTLWPMSLVLVEWTLHKAEAVHWNVWLSIWCQHISDHFISINFTLDAQLSARVKYAPLLLLTAVISIISFDHDEQQ